MQESTAALEHEMPSSLSANDDARLPPSTLEQSEQGDTRQSQSTSEAAPPFQMGDHVYIWCSLLGVPAVYQHHAIVMNVWKKEKRKETKETTPTENDMTASTTPTASIEVASNPSQSAGATTAESGDQRRTPQETPDCGPQSPYTTTDRHANDEDEDDKDGDDVEEWILQIADFSGLEAEPNGKKSASRPSTLSMASSSSKAGSCIRVYECTYIEPKQRKKRQWWSKRSNNDDEDILDWRKVEYQASSNFFKHHFLSRAGTSTSVKSCPPGLVRARLEFLLQHPDILPSYHSIQSNCECVAVWCKTGTFATLQAMSILSVTAAGQIKQTATLASAAAAAQVSVPSAGLWGYFGYTSQVSLLTAQPHLIPILAAWGTLTIGAPLVTLWAAKKKWKECTMQLNNSFWESAIDQPDVFVECITEWSDLH